MISHAWGTRAWKWRKNKHQQHQVKAAEIMQKTTEKKKTAVSDITLSLEVIYPDVGRHTEQPVLPAQVQYEHYQDSNKLVLHQLSRWVHERFADVTRGIQWLAGNHRAVCTCCPDCSRLVPQGLCHPADGRSEEFVCITINSVDWTNTDIRPTDMLQYDNDVFLFL